MDRRVVNEAGETFWLKLVTPSAGVAGGAVRATRPNEWRSVRVSVAGDALEVYAPEGYYATW